MEDFSTILWILVIAAASLLSQGRKTRSGKTSRKPGPATDDTAPHPTPTHVPNGPESPDFRRFRVSRKARCTTEKPGKPRRKALRRLRHAVSSPARKAAKSLSPSRKRPKEHPARISPKPEKQLFFRQMRPQRGSGGTRVPKGGKSRNSDGFRPYNPLRRRSSDFRRQGARPLQRSCRVRSVRTTARASRTGRKRSRQPESPRISICAGP